MKIAVTGKGGVGKTTFAATPGQCTLPVAALPEQGAQHHRTKGTAKTGPCKGYDGEYRAVRVPCQENGYNGNSHNRKTGCIHGSGSAHFDL